MSHRFFADRPNTGDRAELRGDEARHLAAVMRAAPGDLVVLFDGSGAEFAARIAALHKQTVELEIIERREISRELPIAVTLAVALPKGDRQKWLVEKATELGVTRLVPLTTERGVAQPLASALNRLRRTSIEAAKQCGRNRLLEIAPPQPAATFFAAAPADSLRLLADPSSELLARISRTRITLACSASEGPPTLARSASEGLSAVIAAVGPEGGFTPAEIAAARTADWHLVSLGPRTLRVETAALVLAAWAGIAQGETKSDPE